MKLHVFTVFDHAVGAYMTPFFVRSKGEALRSFADAVNGGQAQFGAHPEDFVLMFHGVWDDNSGEFTGVVNGPERVVSALECVDRGSSEPRKGGQAL